LVSDLGIDGAFLLPLALPRSHLVVARRAKFFYGASQGSG